MSTLRGSDDLKRRLKAIGQTFKPLGRKWADSTVPEMRSRVPVRTGRLRASFRRSSATMKRARVSGHFTAYFIDAGPVPHVIKAKKARRLVFERGGRTIFARQVHHRGYRARPFRHRAAVAGLREADPAGTLIDLWNKAA